MPTPVPSPSAAQIVKVAEITMLTVAEVSVMVAADTDAAISNAKWALTLADITLWNNGIRDDTSDLKKVGPIEFFEGVAPKTRLDFRNMIRARYGYSILFYEGQGSAAAIESTLQWF